MNVSDYKCLAFDVGVLLDEKLEWLLKQSDLLVLVDLAYLGDLLL